MGSDVQRAAEWILAAKRIALITHVSPDGDTLGSALALSLALDGLGIDHEVLCEDAVPSVYAFLPGADRVHQPMDAPQMFPLAATIDVSDRQRMGRCAQVFDGASQTLVIDHHHTNPAFGMANLLETCSATGELVLKLLHQVGAEITADIATCLFVAISTDTGNFNYANVTGNAMRAVGELVDAGVDVADVTERVFRKRSPQKTRLIGRSLGGMRLMMNGRVSVQTLTMMDYAAAGAADADTEGLINYGIECEGVEIALLARETAGGIKFSLRSRNALDVGDLAQRFGGGGHAAAAGMTLKQEITQAVDMVLKSIGESMPDA